MKISTVYWVKIDFSNIKYLSSILWPDFISCIILENVNDLKFYMPNILYFYADNDDFRILILVGYSFVITACTNPIFTIMVHLHFIFCILIAWQNVNFGLYRIPLGEEIRTKWMANIVNGHLDKQWTPPTSGHVCSAHFLPTDQCLHTKSGKVTLVSNVVPTIFGAQSIEEHLFTPPSTKRVRQNEILKRWVKMSNDPKCFLDAVWFL